MKGIFVVLVMLLTFGTTANAGLNIFSSNNEQYGIMAIYTLQAADYAQNRAAMLAMYGQYEDATDLLEAANELSEKSTEYFESIWWDISTSDYEGFRVIQQQIIDLP